MSKTGIVYKLKKSFRELGIDLKRNGSFYELEYEHLFILLSVHNETDTFAFSTGVVDAQDGLTKEQLEIALDVVGDFHKNFSVEWYDGVPFFTSPDHFIGNGVELTGEWLEKKLKEFWNAYIFLEANIHLMGDLSIMKCLEPDKWEDRI